jgi:L-ascorbate metabolism protein UlaG (beta-lactamase superfamily)
MTTIQPAVRAGKQYRNPVPTQVGSWSIFPRYLWRTLTTRVERTPRQPLGPFHTNAATYRNPPASGLRLTWMGHSSTLVEIDGARLLIDPVWDERAAPVAWAGPKRFFPPTLPLEQLPPLDAILISHDHYDHLGAATIARLAALDTRWITPRGVGPIITELDWTESVQVGPLALMAMPARHFSGRSLFNRFQTLWASFVIAGPTHRIFYGADSGEWDGFAEIGRTHGPFDLTMLEIGAFDPMWADIHMGPDGAARTFAAMGATGLLMPVHWGLFDLALHAWRDPIERLFSLEGLPLWSPEPGLPTEIHPGVQLRSQWWKP